eukprot:m.45868 g.45868  ORF g.45868 m.45868 type:complete len:311 (+) comp10902_c0_seq1:173-1105(+)
MTLESDTKYSNAVYLLVLVVACVQSVYANDTNGGALLTTVETRKLCSWGLHGPPTTPLQAYRWLHIPKCGTSLSTVLYHYSCNELPDDAVPDPGKNGKGLAVKHFTKTYNLSSCNFQQFRGPRIGHTPLKLGEISSGIQMVAMFRDPRARIWSAYNYGMHQVGMTGDDRRKMYQTVKTPQDYAAFPGIAGCQTKMLLGIKCNKNVPVTDDMVERAIGRLKQFAFVGLTDEWNDSVCLFYRMFGGDHTPNAFKNVRDTADASGSHAYVRSKGLEVFDVDVDPADWEVYQAAKAIFREKQAQYGMPHPIVHT